MLRDYKLDPPDEPDQGEPCASCGKEIGEECFYVGLPGRRHLGPIIVCSTQCKTDYLIGYVDSIMDRP